MIKRYLLAILILVMPQIPAQASTTCNAEKLDSNTSTHHELFACVKELLAFRESMRGMVAAFDLAGKCPDGWDPFDEANDKLIIGSGAYTKFRATKDAYPKNKDKDIVQKTHKDGGEYFYPTILTVHDGVLYPAFISLKYCKKK